MRTRLLISLLAVLAAGCGGGKGSSSETRAAQAAQPKPKVKTPEELIRTEFAKLQSSLNSSSVDPRAKMELVRGFIARARRRVPEKEIPEVRSAEQRVVDLQQSLEIAAKDAFEELKGRVMEEIEKKTNADHVRAEEMVDRFPDKDHPGTDVKQWVKELRETILLYQEADSDYLRRADLIKTFSNDYARMVAVLEGFDPRYDKTPAGEKIRELIKETYESFVVNQKDLTRAGAETKRVDFAKRFVDGPKDLPVEFDEEAEILTFGPNPGDYEARDTKGSVMMLGSEAWVDVGVTIDMKITKLEDLRLGVKGREGDEGLVWVPIALDELGIDGPVADDWVQVTVSTNLALVSVTCLTTDESKTFEHEFPDVPGRFVVQILGDEAAVQIRSMSYRTSDRNAVAEDSDDSDSEESGKLDLDGLDSDPDDSKDK